MNVDDIPPSMRDDLIAYLMCDSPDRPRLVEEMLARNPSMRELLVALETDDDLRARLEMTLLRG